MSHYCDECGTPTAAADRNFTEGGGVICDSCIAKGQHPDMSQAESQKLCKVLGIEWQGITPQQLEALKLLRTYCGGTLFFRRLTGPAKATCRAHILSVLTGTKVPKSKAGIHALEEALYAFVKPEGQSPSAQEQAFQQWVGEQLKDE